MGHDARLARAGAPRSWPTTAIPGYLAALCGVEGDRRLDADFELVRETFHRFAEEQIRPRAEHIHRANADIPEEIIAGLAEMGAFGLSIPEEYGGLRHRRRERLHGHGGGHRGALVGIARRRRLADHPPRDPVAAPWWRAAPRAEAAVAAERWRRARS